MLNTLKEENLNIWLLKILLLILYELWTFIYFLTCSYHNFFMIAIIVHVIYQHAQWILGKAVLHKTFGSRLKTFPAMPLLSKLMCLWAFGKSVLQEQLPQAVATPDVSISYSSNWDGKEISTILEKLLLILSQGYNHLDTCPMASFLETSFFFQQGKNFPFLICYGLSRTVSSHFAHYCANTVILEISLQTPPVHSQKKISAPQFTLVVCCSVVIRATGCMEMTLTILKHCIFSSAFISPRANDTFIN